MIDVKKNGVLLEKTALRFENEGVLNPAVIFDTGFIHMFYRAVSVGNFSSIGYCKFNSKFKLIERSETPILFPQNESESHGLEDPRIVKIDDLFYLTYTSYDGVNALGSLATSTDLKQFTKHGIIVPEITYDEFMRLAQTKNTINEKYIRYNEEGKVHEKLGKKVFVWDKNVVFFPRRINKKLYFMHRIRPDIQLVCINELSDLTPEFWQNYFLHLEDYILLSPKHDHEVSYIGGGCPPIETPEGWIVIYHGVHDTINGYVYSACVALLDLSNPQKEIARLPYMLFNPEYIWELLGEVNNVCFPTGAIVVGDLIHIFYGAADEQIAYATVSLSELLKELKLFPNRNL